LSHDNQTLLSKLDFEGAVKLHLVLDHDGYLPFQNNKNASKLAMISKGDTLNLS